MFLWDTFEIKNGTKLYKLGLERFITRTPSNFSLQFLLSFSKILVQRQFAIVKYTLEMNKSLRRTLCLVKILQRLNVTNECYRVESSGAVHKLGKGRGQQRILHQFLKFSTYFLACR